VPAGRDLQVVALTQLPALQQLGRRGHAQRPRPR
jgi:hypothetical protein